MASMGYIIINLVMDDGIDHELRVEEVWRQT